MLVEFKNITDAKVSDTFREALAKYPILHSYLIELRQQKIKASTMQARPVLTHSRIRCLLSGFHHKKNRYEGRENNREILFQRNKGKCN
jgi:hypothetical protein